MRSDERITLSDGRTLGYAEYGQPDGRPIFYFHGFPSSRLEIAPEQDLASRLGLRLIAVDRPGYGLSDFQPGRRIVDWPTDVMELANALDLDRFAVIGFSGGGPYAAACAWGLPEQLTGAAIVAGSGLPHTPNANLGIQRGNRMLLFLRRRTPWLLRPLFDLTAAYLRCSPEKFLQTIRREIPIPDRRILADPERAQALVVNLREAFRTDGRGAAWDGRLLGRDWGFRLADIQIKIDLWYGELDANVPPVMGRYLAGLIPGCEAHFLENEAHLSLHANYIEEIFKGLCAN